MGWIRLEELLPHHRKLMACGHQAPTILGYYMAGIAFANRHLTDGVILPDDLPLLIPACRPKPALIAKLVNVKLWDVRPEGGWVIHDFLEHNCSAAYRLGKLRADAERKKRGLRPDSARNPNGFHKDSERIPDVEEKRREVEEKQKRSRRDEKTRKTSLSRWRETACRLLDFLNERTGARFEPVPPNLALLAARLEDGATEAQIRGVIVHKIREWRGGEMEKFLRPKTLFNATNYAQYRGEIAREAANGELP